jgi:hypothetical protein
MAKLIGAKGGTPAPKGGGKIVSTTRNGSFMKQSKGQGADAAGPDIASASTPTGKMAPGSGGKTGSSPSLSKTFVGSGNAGDAGSDLGGGRKLGCIYGNK